MSCSISPFRLGPNVNARLSEFRKIQEHQTECFTIAKRPALFFYGYKGFPISNGKYYAVVAMMTKRDGSIAESAIKYERNVFFKFRNEKFDHIRERLLKQKIEISEFSYEVDPIKMACHTANVFFIILR